VTNGVALRHACCPGNGLVETITEFTCRIQPIGVFYAPTGKHRRSAHEGDIVVTSDEEHLESVRRRTKQHDGRCRADGRDSHRFSILPP
jgi:hypothetical protein